MKRKRKQQRLGSTTGEQKKLVGKRRFLASPPPSSSTSHHSPESSSPHKKIRSSQKQRHPPNKQPKITPNNKKKKKKNGSREKRPLPQSQLNTEYRAQSWLKTLIRIDVAFSLQTRHLTRRNLTPKLTMIQFVRLVKESCHISTRDGFTVVGSIGEMRELEADERMAVIFLTIGSPELVRLEQQPSSSSSPNTASNNAKDSVTAMVTLILSNNNNNSQAFNRTEQWKRLYTERWNESANNVRNKHWDTFRNMTRVVQNRIPKITTNRQQDANGNGNNDNSTTTIRGEHYIQPNMSLEDRVKARHDFYTKRQEEQQQRLKDQKGSIGLTSPRNLLRFADAVRLYVRHCHSRSVAFVREEEEEDESASSSRNPSVVVSLKELRRYFYSSGGAMTFSSFSSGGGGGGVHAAQVSTRRNTERRAVLTMTERLCELVPEWITVVDSDVKKRKKKKKSKTKGGGDEDDDVKTWSKNAVVVLRQDVEYRNVRDAILASGGKGCRSTNAVSKTSSNLLLGNKRRLDRPSGRTGLRFLGDSLDNSLADRKRHFDDATATTVNKREKQKKELKQNWPLLSSDEESDSELLTQEEDQSSKPCTTAVEMTKEGKEKHNGSSTHTRDTRQSKRLATKIQSKVDKLLQDDRKQQPSHPSTPTYGVSLKLSSTRIKKERNLKQSLTRQERNQQQSSFLGGHTPKTPALSKDSSSSKVFAVAATPSTSSVHKKERPAADVSSSSPSSTNSFFLHINNENSMHKDNHRKCSKISPPVVVVEEDQEMKTPPRLSPPSPDPCRKSNGPLRVNHNLHLTDADANGGILIETGEACPRDLKKMFTLLNAGKRI